MRKDGTLRFGDFVSAILHLSDAFGTLLMIFSIILHILDLYALKYINRVFYIHLGIFESKDPLQNGTIKLSLSEVRPVVNICFYES